MPLTHKETGLGGLTIFPMKIAQASLIETSYSSTGAVAEECAIALGFKPTAATSPPLNDMTGHYLLTIRKQGGTVTAWKQGVELDAYQGDVGATYAEFVQNVLAHYAGSHHGYYSRLVIVETALDYSPFWAASEFVTGLWVPAPLSGLAIHTLLDFSDAADPGRDSSGNGNDWIIGGAPAQTSDTPTNNHCTLNALVPSGSALSNGNLTATTPAEGINDVTATFRVPGSGKWAWEVAFDSGSGFYCGGVYDNGDHFRVYTTPSPQRLQWSIAGVPGSLFDLSGFTVGRTATFEFDGDNGDLYLRIDGVPENGGNPIITGMPGGFLPVVGDGGGTESCATTCEFGARGFTQTVSPGFLALCSANLPDPVIIRSDTVADIVLRKGTGAAASLSSLSFPPDFIDIKSRTNTYSWNVFDSERGALNVLHTDSAAAAYNLADSLTSLNADGYSLGTEGNVNKEGSDFIDLCLKAGNDQGFEIVKWTGNSVAGRTISHNLGKAPAFILVKNMSSANSWAVYHIALGATKVIWLDLHSAAVVNSGYWNDTEPTATEITLGDSAEVNYAGREYIAYLFADSDIFKAFSYTGNGTVDGPFASLDGKPLKILLKNADTGSTNWLDHDSARGRFNTVDGYLAPDDLAAESSVPGALSFTSQGIKVGATNAAWNNSTDTIVGLAVLEAATKYSNAY